jgi:riboflavin kinase/FMN adenylyltransferase
LQVLSDFVGTELDRELVLTVGTYDGLHRGHQRLVRALIARSKETGTLSGLITFDPHPRSVLYGGEPTPCLMTATEKAELLEEMGLDVLIILRFTPELSRLSAREFVLRAVRHLRMRELWVGAGFALGRDREGDVAALRSLAREYGFELRVVQTVQDDGDSISSSRIRSLLVAGDVAKAADMLGRPFKIRGELVVEVRPDGPRALHRFRMVSQAQCLLPADGAYAASIVASRQRYAALLSINTVTKSGDDERTVQGYLLDSEGDLGRSSGEVVAELFRPLPWDLTLRGEGQAVARVEEYLQEIQRVSRVTAEGPG